MASWRAANIATSKGSGTGMKRPSRQTKHLTPPAPHWPHGRGRHELSNADTAAGACFAVRSLIDGKAAAKPRGKPATVVWAPEECGQIAMARMMLDGEPD